MENPGDCLPTNDPSSNAKTGAAIRTTLIMTVLAVVACAVFILIAKMDGGPFWFVFAGVVFLIIAGSYFYRCPACGGAIAESHNGFCTRCGSKTANITRWSATHLTFEAPRPAGASLQLPRAVEILEKSPDSFRFRFKKSHALAFFLLALGLFLALTLCQTVVVECARNESGGVDCLAYSSLAGCRLSSKSIQGVLKMELEYSDRPRRLHRHGTRSGGANITLTEYKAPPSRAVFITANSTIPLTQSFSNISDAGSGKDMSNRVNQFISDTSKKKATFTQTPPGWAWLLVGACVFGAFSVAFGPRDEFYLDRNGQCFHVLRRSWTKSFRLDFPLAALAQFGVIQKTKINRRSVSGGAKTYCLGARLVSGAIIHLENGASMRYAWRRDAAIFLENQRTHFTAPPAVASEARPRQQTFSVADKTCVVCLRNCGDEPRYKDEQGRYFHQACYPNSVLVADVKRSN